MRLCVYGPYFLNAEVEYAMDRNDSKTGPILRIRKRDGSTQIVPKGVFVEICDEAGNVGCVLYQTSKGSVRVITPEDINEVQHYKGIFKVPFCSDILDVQQTIHDNSNPKSA